MSSLNASLASALSGLMADQAALETTTNNVANISTPGYSRQVPIMVTSDPIVLDPLTLGTGVTLKSIESIRDPILESRIQQETQTQGQMDSLVGALSQTQVSFTSSTADIGTSISNFFNSVNQLSTSPTDLSLRQGLLTAANSLASAFNLTANNLTTQRGSIDGSIKEDVGQINELTKQIAELNVKISNLQNIGASAGTFVDQRTQAIDQLASLVDVIAIPTDNTLTLTTATGTPLVAGQISFQLTTAPDLTDANVQHVFSQGNDITSTLVSGQLGGLIQARDQQIPAILTQLDSLAAGLATAVNRVQTGGYDLNGNPTGVLDIKGNPQNAVPLFSFINPPPAKGAAASLAVVITDPAKIAASSDGAAGSNGNAEAMYAVSSQPIIQGQSASDYYSSVVFNVGNAVASATAEQSASDLALRQLSDQRASISGVSLDQEAANLMRYQQAYAASAQVITTINQMMQTVINMKN